MDRQIDSSSVKCSTEVSQIKNQKDRGFQKHDPQGSGDMGTSHHLKNSALHTPGNDRGSEPFQ